MESEKTLEALIGEIHSLESEIRQTLRSSALAANLSAVVLAIAAAGGSKQGLGAAAFSVLPIIMNVVGLSYLNSAIDAAMLAEQRDWLSAQANALVGSPVFVTGTLSTHRRSSRSGVSVNVLSVMVLVGTWVGGIAAANGHPWFYAQIVITAILVLLSAVAFSDFATIRRRTRAQLAMLQLPGKDQTAISPRS